MLPEDVAGKDAIELGCGPRTSRLLKRARRAGGRHRQPEAQLATARRLQREHGLDFPLLHCNAESVP